MRGCVAVLCLSFASTGAGPPTQALLPAPCPQVGLAMAEPLKSRHLAVENLREGLNLVSYEGPWEGELLATSSIKQYTVQKAGFFNRWSGFRPTGGDLTLTPHSTAGCAVTFTMGFQGLYYLGQENGEWRDLPSKGRYEADFLKEVTRRLAKSGKARRP